MPLASFTFLYLFLPVSLAVYYLFPQRMRYGVLLGISLVFFLLGDPCLPFIFIRFRHSGLWARAFDGTL